MFMGPGSESPASRLARGKELFVSKTDRTPGRLRRLPLSAILPLATTQGAETLGTTLAWQPWRSRESQILAVSRLVLVSCSWITVII
jgi:hypothetical protein